MPPKVKVTKDDIVKTAIELVREHGEEALGARAIAARIGCSTQPVFSNFATMEELRRAVIAAAYDIYLDFLRREAEGGKYPQYKAFGMAYLPKRNKTQNLRSFGFVANRRLFNKMKQKHTEGFCGWSLLPFSDSMV